MPGDENETVPLGGGEGGGSPRWQLPRPRIGARKMDVPSDGVQALGVISHHPSSDLDLRVLRNPCLASSLSRARVAEKQPTEVFVAILSFPIWAIFVQPASSGGFTSQVA